MGKRIGGNGSCNVLLKLRAAKLHASEQISSLWQFPCNRKMLKLEFHCSSISVLTAHFCAHLNIKEKKLVLHTKNFERKLDAMVSIDYGN